jgi:hypothetical protein
MLRAACGKQISLALAAILAGAVVWLVFADLAQAGRGGGGGFHGGGGGASMVAGAAASMVAGAAASMVAGAAASMVAEAFIPLAVFVAAAFIPSTPRRAGDAVTARAASDPIPPAATPVAMRATAIMVAPVFRTASSQATAPSRTA